MKPYYDAKAYEKANGEDVNLPSCLPAGAYQGKILKAEEEFIPTKNGQIHKLNIFVDVAEGEYKDFYMNKFKAFASGGNSKYPNKYKGVLRLEIPERGDEYEDSKLNRLKRNIHAIEDSNDGYTWDWDEQKLKGKKVGLIVREFDWLMDGRHGTSTEIGKLCKLQDVIDGKARLMPKRELRAEEQAQVIAQDNAIRQLEEDTDEELPF